MLLMGLNRIELPKAKALISALILYLTPHGCLLNAGKPDISFKQA